MLLGEYAYAMDAKGRLFIPARLRDELTHNLVLSKSVDPCINVYSEHAFTCFAEKLSALPEIETREIRRFLFSSAQEVSLDAQGRILLSAHLRDYAALQKDVLILGVGDHAEIWDRDRYEAHAARHKTEDIVRILTEREF